MYPCLLLMKVLAEYDLQLCACSKRDSCVPVLGAVGMGGRVGRKGGAKRGDRRGEGGRGGQRGGGRGQVQSDFN